VEIFFEKDDEKMLYVYIRLKKSYISFGESPQRTLGGELQGFGDHNPEELRIKLTI